MLSYLYSHQEHCIVLSRAPSWPYGYLEIKKGSWSYILGGKCTGNKYNLLTDDKPYNLLTSGCKPLLKPILWRLHFQNKCVMYISNSILKTDDLLYTENWEYLLLCSLQPLKMNTSLYTTANGNFSVFVGMFCSLCLFVRDAPKFRPLKMIGRKKKNSRKYLDN